VRDLRLTLEHNQVLGNVPDVMEAIKKYGIILNVNTGYLAERFQKRIFVPLPNIDARTEMLEMSTSPLHMDSQVKMSQLADILDGYSGSDITDICQSVQLKVVSELFETGRASEAESRPREITIEDIKDVLKRRRPSVSTDMIRAYDNWSENYKAL